MIILDILFFIIESLNSNWFLLCICYLSKETRLIRVSLRSFIQLVSLDHKDYMVYMNLNYNYFLYLKCKFVSIHIPF